MTLMPVARLTSVRLPSARRCATASSHTLPCTATNPRSRATVMSATTAPARPAQSLMTSLTQRKNAARGRDSVSRTLPMPLSRFHWLVNLIPPASSYQHDLLCAQRHEVPESLDADASWRSAQEQSVSDDNGLPTSVCNARLLLMSTAPVPVLVAMMCCVVYLMCMHRQAYISFFRLLIQYILWS
jgi:hypothetical protein